MRISISLLLLFCCSQSLSAQTIHTRTKLVKSLTWNDSTQKFDKDSSSPPFKTFNPKVILTFEHIQIIDRDTSTIYLNDLPTEEADSIAITKNWDDATTQQGRDCNIRLFHILKDNFYIMRVFFADDEYNTGIEYILNPLTEAVIPDSKSIPTITK